MHPNEILEAEANLIMLDQAWRNGGKSNEALCEARDALIAQLAPIHEARKAARVIAMRATA